MKTSTPETLLKSAKRVKIDHSAFDRIDYGEVIFTLKYKKCMTWEDVGDWLTAKGCKSTKHTAKAAFHAWRHKQGYGQLAYDADGEPYFLEPVPPEPPRKYVAPRIDRIWEKAPKVNENEKIIKQWLTDENHRLTPPLSEQELNTAAALMDKANCPEDFAEVRSKAMKNILINFLASRIVNS